MQLFRDSLPAELEGKDFRVIDPGGGYRTNLETALRMWDGFFDLTIVHEFTEMSVRVFPRAQLNWPVTEDVITFQPMVGVLLDQDQQPTLHEVEVFYLELDLDVSREGLTVGSLRMKQVRETSNHEQLAG